jgi:hypothetical protein
MLEFVVAFLVGVLCIVIGIFNMKGNIEMLHSYHRKRVSEEDRLPFGKLVGKGMIIMGVSIMIFSVLSALTLYLENDVYTIIGVVIMAVGFIVGLGMAFYAMIKYNKGIF